MERVTYQCNVLQGINKVGDLKKLDNGYYEVRLGALNARNSQGWLYDEAAGRRLIEGSNGLMRMIETGRLRGEAGHPRYQPGMTQLQWFSRVNDILESNTCVHIRRIRLDHGKDEQGRPITMVIGEVRSSGPESTWLDKQLENRDEDVCFSIRSFTEDRVVSGIKTKFLKKIVNWDVVNEPGLANSSKYGTPSLESMGPEPKIVMPTADLETIFYPEALRNEVARIPKVEGVGMESHQNVVTMIANLERPVRSFVPHSWKW